MFVERTMGKRRWSRLAGELMDGRGQRGSRGCLGSRDLFKGAVH